MRVFRYLLVFAGCCLSAPIPTRAPRPSFLGVPDSKTPIAGHFSLRIGAKPPARPLPFLPPAPVGTAKARVTVYLDGSLFLSEEAPLTYDWDTSAVRSGPHTLLLRWIDPTNHNEQTLEKITLLVANDSRPVIPPTPVAPVESHESHDTVAAPVESQPGSTEAPVAEPAAVTSAPGRRVLATLHPQQSSLALTPNAHPLDAHATALNLVGDRLCIGLPDGGLTLYDCKRRKGQSLRLPQPTGKVVAIQ
ncbi:MAG: hypothetical protein JWL77_4316, partial [Chthonomonadaceae bacterium]|nr:hypothetical protein [Chthonomonadaceae bacterium]